MLSPHHQRAPDRVVAEFSEHPDVEAIVLGGSLVKGFGRPGNDLDVMLVIDEAAYVERQCTGALTFAATELADFENGYVDGKFVSRSFRRSRNAR